MTLYSKKFHNFCICQRNFSIKYRLLVLRTQRKGRCHLGSFENDNCIFIWWWRGISNSCHTHKAETGRQGNLITQFENRRKSSLEPAWVSHKTSFCYCPIFCLPSAVYTMCTIETKAHPKIRHAWGTISLSYYTLRKTWEIYKHQIFISVWNPVTFPKQKR